ncbi:MAG: 3-keto-5-aminohexanoate cleavage protein [Desulfosalsimonas sp.]
MEKRIIITAAVTGSSPTKEMNPALPYTPEEIADAAIDCHKAGAAIAHIHVRDPETGEPAFETGLFRRVTERIREHCDMLVNLTTSGLRLTGPNVTEKRLEPVYLKPDMCSLDLGSVNFRDRVFYNPPQWAEQAARTMQQEGVKPEIEAFEPGHIEQAKDLIERGLIDPPACFQLCMGVRWGIDASSESLMFMKSRLPEGVKWSVLGIGAAQLPMITMGILLGGNIRVGFEDNIYLKKGVPARDNAQMVEVAAELAERLGRQVATPAEARQMLFQ